MSTTKGISKKKKLLKTLMDKYITFKVLFYILAYSVLGFINIPINKWLTFNCPKWSSAEYPPLFGAVFVLPLSELLIFAIIEIFAEEIRALAE